MKECKFKFSKDQLETLAFYIGRLVDAEPHTINEALIYSVFAKLWEKLQVKLIRLHKPKCTISFNTTESLAMLLYFNGQLPNLEVDSYLGNLILTIRDQIAQTYSDLKTT